MLAAAIIVFRETLEAALIVSVVLAATQQIAGSRRWVSLGVVVGLVGAGLAALLADTIASAAAGVGQELFNAIVLLAAVVMLGWHNVWMQQHGKEMAQRLKAAGQAISAGEQPLYALAIVVGLAVLREGSETVLFLYGIAAAGDGGMSSLVGGLAIGLAAGAAVGGALYFGLLRIPQRYLFRVTSGLILLLAAGLAAQASNFLVQGGFVPSLGGAVWDTSWLLSESSVVGRVLHTLIGYVDTPTVVQLIAYGLTIAVIGGLMWTLGSQRQPPVARPAGATPQVGAE